jgi:hypothetical protein
MKYWNLQALISTIVLVGYSCYLAYSVIFSTVPEFWFIEFLLIEILFLVSLAERNRQQDFYRIKDALEYIAKK